MAAPLRPGFHPFWFWNARLEEPEVRRQVREMAAQGIAGFHVHPRQGLHQPYLSTAFFAMLDAAVDEAARSGLAVHLYDEYPYPSGVAGGEVVLGNPAAHQTRLVQRGFDLPGGRVRLELPRGRVLCCTAFPRADGAVLWDRPRDLRPDVGLVLSAPSYAEMGLTPYNRKRFFASDPVPTLEAELPGPHRLSVSVQVEVTDHKYWGHFADVLDPQVVAEFLRRTHERYAARYADRFGSVILSIFADETAPGWSATLPAAFRERYGEELGPLLPALAEPDHPEHLRVQAALWDLRHERFCAAFEQPVASWCRAHGLRYAAEKPVLRLSQLRFTDIPGCDAGHVKAGRPLDLLAPHIRGNARAAASAAYCYGKEGALCECYHSLGWAASLQDAKRIADGLLLLGVEHLVPHAFFYSTHGLRKHDAPPSFFVQTPAWPLFHHLCAHVAAVTAALAGTHPDASVLVVEPSAGLPGPEERATYAALLGFLMARHVEFLLVDTDVLQEAVAAAGAAPGLPVRDVRAAAVVVPPLRRIEPALAAALDGAARHAAVLRLAPGPLPPDLDAALQAAAPPALRIEATGGDAGAVWVAARREGGRRLWFLLNTSGEDVALDLVPVDGPGLREHPLGPPPGRLEARPEGAFRRVLAAHESCLLEAGPPQPPVQATIVPLRLPARAACTLDRPNVLRLAAWKLELRGAPGGPRPVRPAPLANQLQEAGFELRPAIGTRFGLPPAVDLPPLDLTYTAEFDCDPAGSGPVAVVVEPDAVGGDWRLRLSDGPALTAADLRPVGAPVPGCLGVDVSAALRQGRNRLVLEVAGARPDGGLRCPLYLAGDFGVRTGPVPAIAARPAASAPLDWEGAGLPHFAGVAEWRGPWELPPAARAALEAGRPAFAAWDWPGPTEEACAVAIGDGPWHPMLWSPRLCPLGPEAARPGLEIAVRVFTSLSRAFEGERFDPRTHRYEPV